MSRGDKEAVRQLLARLPVTIIEKLNEHGFLSFCPQGTGIEYLITPSEELRDWRRDKGFSYWMRKLNGNDRPVFDNGRNVFIQARIHGWEVGEELKAIADQIWSEKLTSLGDAAPLVEPLIEAFHKKDVPALEKLMDEFLEKAPVEFLVRYAVNAGMLEVLHLIEMLSSSEEDDSYRWN